MEYKPQAVALTPQKIKEKIEKTYNVILQENGSPILTAIRNIKKRTFLECYYALNGNVTKTCIAARISRKTYYLWLQNDPQFRAIILEQEQQLCDKLEGELIKRATEGKDDTALIFALKSLHPKYKPQKESIAFDNRSGNTRFVLTRG